MDSAECSAEDSRFRRLSDSKIECKRLVFEAVNEISLIKLKTVMTSYSQMELLMSLIGYNEKGETPLVIAMKGGNFSLIDKLVNLLRNGSLEKLMQPLDRELRKMFLSVSIEQLTPHFPILELIDHLVQVSNYANCHDYEWLDFMAQAVFNSSSLSRQNKITALELIGASHTQCDIHFSKCYPVMFRCWRDAIFLRYFPADGEPLLPKIPDISLPSAASSVVFGRLGLPRFGSAVEVTSIDELNLMQEDIERNVVELDAMVQFRGEDLLNRQSLLVIRRISNQANLGHPCLFYLRSLYVYATGVADNIPGVHYGNVMDYEQDGQDDQVIVINTFLLILEQMTGFDPKMLPPKLYDMFFDTLHTLSEFYEAVTREDWEFSLAIKTFKRELYYENLPAFTKFISTIARFFPNPAVMSLVPGFGEIIARLVFALEFFSSERPELNNQEKQQMEDHLSSYIRNYFLEGTSTVLHYVARSLKYPKYNICKNLEPIKLMIKLGADPNAIDEKVRTPLQILAGNPLVYSDEAFPIFRALVDAGAHLDMATQDGDTVLDIVKKNLSTIKDAAANAYFSSLVKTSIFPLSCYCARVIRRNGIPYDEDRLPFHLQEFVSCHSAKGPIGLQQPEQRHD